METNKTRAVDLMFIIIGYLFRQMGFQRFLESSWSKTTRILMLRRKLKRQTREKCCVKQPTESDGWTKSNYQEAMQFPDFADVAYEFSRIAVRKQQKAVSSSFDGRKGVRHCEFYWNVYWHLPQN